MQVELRSTSDVVCSQCGAHELLKVKKGPTSPVEPLVSELRLELPWWAFVRRRWLTSLVRKVDEAEARMIDDARYPLVEGEN